MLIKLVLLSKFNTKLFLLFWVYFPSSSFVLANSRQQYTSQPFIWTMFCKFVISVKPKEKFIFFLLLKWLCNYWLHAEQLLMRISLGRTLKKIVMDQIHPNLKKEWSHCAALVSVVEGRGSFVNNLTTSQLYCSGTDNTSSSHTVSCPDYQATLIHSNEDIYPKLLAGMPYLIAVVIEIVQLLSVVTADVSSVGPQTY